MQSLKLAGFTALLYAGVLFAQTPAPSQPVAKAATNGATPFAANAAGQSSSSNSSSSSGQGSSGNAAAKHNLREQFGADSRAGE
jgi:hypothetical protein